MVRVTAAGRAFDVACIVFDKDGTLLDFDFTWGKRTSAWVKALSSLFPNENNIEEYFARNIGYDWARQQVMPDGPVAVTTAQKLITLAAGALYRQGYAWHEAEKLALRTIQQEMGAPFHPSEIRPLGDVRGSLQRLQEAGLHLAVLTGDDRRPTIETLTLLGIADTIEIILCGDDPIPEKPDPAALFHIGERLQIAPEQMLMVGDTVNDMLTGRNASVAACIGVTGSTGDPLKLSPYADVMIPAIDHLSVNQ
jgi:phosphoglycolate phosphatase-like HAD superfamily hydrolase